MSEEVRSALREHQGSTMGIGEAPVFPAPRNWSKSLSRDLPTKWWKPSYAKLGETRRRAKKEPCSKADIPRIAEHFEREWKTHIAALTCEGKRRADDIGTLEVGRYSYKSRRRFSPS